MKENFFRHKSVEAVIKKYEFWRKKSNQTIKTEKLFTIFTLKIGMIQ